jgi:hypothetical protein
MPAQPVVSRVPESAVFDTRQTQGADHGKLHLAAEMTLAIGIRDMREP